jgi:histone H3/H4
MADETTERAKSFVVESRMRAFLKEHEMNTDVHLADALSQEVQGVLETAVVRAKENNRKTVRPIDL